MFHSYITTLKKYTIFTGRAGRGEYWIFVFGSAIIFFLLFLLISLAHIISSAFNVPYIITIISFVVYSLFFIGILIPHLSLLIRRLHDTSRSAWWLLMLFIPFGILVLILFLVQEGSEGENEYGLDPEYNLE